MRTSGRVARKPTHGALLEAWKAGRAEEREAQGGKMSDLPEAVKAAEAIHGDCQCRNRCHVKDHTGTVQVCVPCKDEIAEVAAIISSAFAPLVEERDRMSAACNSLERIGNKAADYCNQIADQLDQLQAKLDAVVGAVSKLRAALKPGTGGDDGK